MNSTVSDNAAAKRSINAENQQLSIVSHGQKELIKTDDLLKPVVVIFQA